MIHWFLKTPHFIPTLHEETVFNIDFEALYSMGKRHLLIDLDNTLIPYDEALPNDDLRAFFDRVKTLGYTVTLVSNNKTARVEPFALAVKVDFISNAKKPTKIGLKKAMRLNAQYPKSETLMIGDQLMTDVYGAKRFGIDVVLVKAIKKKSEKWYTKINRIVEEKMLKKIAKKYPKEYRELGLGKR